MRLEAWKDKFWLKGNYTPEGVKYWEAFYAKMEAEAIRKNKL